MTFPVVTLRKRIAETLAMHDAGRFDAFWFMSGAIAAKLEDYGFYRLTQYIRDSASGFDHQYVYILLELADVHLSHEPSSPDVDGRFAQ